MKTYIRNNPLAFFVLICGSILLISLLFSVIYGTFNLDIFQKSLSIAGSFSLVVAIITYFNAKKREETLATIEQITFFREKIIPAWDKLQEAIKNKNPDYWFSRIMIDTYTIEHIKYNKGELSKNFDNQLSIFFDSSKSDWKTWIDNEILGRQIYLLNILEEFSLKVSHFNTQQHPALNSIHHAFVEIIEKNATVLFFIRDVIVANPIYNTTLLIYSSWKNKINKSSLAKNLKKYDFISKEQFKDLLKKQREGASK